MTRLQAEAGSDVSNFAVRTRVQIVIEGVQAAEAALEKVRD